MVSPEEVSLVQASWAKVVPISDTAADLFYQKLFELDASLEKLFPEEMSDPWHMALPVARSISLFIPFSQASFTKSVWISQVRACLLFLNCAAWLRWHIPHLFGETTGKSFIFPSTSIFSWQALHPTFATACLLRAQS